MSAQPHPPHGHSHDHGHDHSHSHHHHAHERTHDRMHTSAPTVEHSVRVTAGAPGFSLLTCGLAPRLALAAGLIGVVCAASLWALAP